MRGQGLTLITKKLSGGIARLTLISPSTLNALSDAMIAALQAELDGLGRD